MTFDPGISEWGNPVRATALPRKRGEPGELKHLSSRRKRKQHVIPKVAASEIGRAQTELRAIRGSDRIYDSSRLAELFWEVRPERVRVP